MFWWYRTSPQLAASLAGKQICCIWEYQLLCQLFEGRPGGCHALRGRQWLEHYGSLSACVGGGTIALLIGDRCTADVRIEVIIGDNPCVADINSCSHLFLDELTELPCNGLRVVVCEGLVSPKAGSLGIAGKVLSDLHEIGVTEKSRYFEITWGYYVAYSVINESFAKRSPEEEWTGHLFRVYKKSRFIDFVGAATFATDEHPGPMIHVGLVCEDHIVDVISTKEPSITKLSPDVKSRLDTDRQSKVFLKSSGRSDQSS